MGRKTGAVRTRLLPPVGGSAANLLHTPQTFLSPAEGFCPGRTVRTALVALLRYTNGARVSGRSWEETRSVRGGLMVGRGAAIPARTNRCPQRGAGRARPHRVPRRSKPRGAGGGKPPQKRTLRPRILAAGERPPDRGGPGTDRSAPPRSWASRPLLTSPGASRADSDAPAEPRLPPIGRSPSKISGGARQPCARAVTLSAHPTPCSTRSNPHAAIGRDGWTKLCIFA